MATCRDVFLGRRPTDNKYLSYITDLFLPLIDSESGDFRCFPFPGALTEQPYITMETLKLIQLNYRITMKEKMSAQHRR